MNEALTAETISITGHGGDEIEAYVARPLGPGPFPGVVVIHHMPGYDSSTKEITRKFAAHGYAALMPNLYHRDAPARAPMTPPPPHGREAASLMSGWSATWPERPPTCAPWTARTAGWA